MEIFALVVVAAIAGFAYIVKMLIDSDKARDQALEAILNGPPMWVTETRTETPRDIQCPHCGHSLLEQPDGEQAGEPRG